MTSRSDDLRCGCRPGRPPASEETPAHNWDVFTIAYTELRRCGVSHDPASDKALYLAARGPLPEVRNWPLLAQRCVLNEARRADNSRCVSLFAAPSRDAEGQHLILVNVLPTNDPEGDPERMALARDELSRVPPHIVCLFTNRDRRLTNADYSRIHRFRRAHGRRRPQERV